MKKILLVLSLSLSVFSSPHAHAMDSMEQSKAVHGHRFFKALYSGLQSYKSKAKNKGEISGALEIIKLIMDCNNSDLYAQVRTQLYDTKGLPELIASIQRAVDLKLKPGNIIKGGHEAKEFITFFNTRKDALLAQILKNNYVEKAHEPLKIIKTDLFKNYIENHVKTDFKHILKALYLGLQEAVIYACNITDDAHYGKKKNQLGHLASIEQYLDDTAQLSTKFSDSIKRAIIDQIYGKISQVVQRAEYVVEHSVSVSENSEDEAPAKIFYRWDLKGLAFELEMLIKVVALESVLGKLTHYNYIIIDKYNNYREVTEFDFITEKAVIEVKAAFLDRNNQTQITKAKNQLRNQLDAIEKYNLPKVYIFIGSTGLLSRAYFDNVLTSDVLGKYKLSTRSMLYTNNTDVQHMEDALNKVETGEFAWRNLPFLSADTNADRYRNISERVHYLREKVNLPLEKDECSSDESIQSAEDKDSPSEIEHISPENRVLYKPEKLENLVLERLPAPVKDFIVTLQKVIASNNYSYYNYPFQMESKL